jgi:transposase
VDFDQHLLMETKADIHDCPWRNEVLKLQESNDALQAEIALLKRKVFGKRSEKMPPIKPKNTKASDEQTKAKRQERKAQRKELPEVVYTHSLEDKDKHCPRCGSLDFKQVGEGRTSIVYEYVPARFLRQVHVQETWACSCGEHLITAKGPTKPVEGGQYGAGFIANIVTAKCCDSIPLYRMEKQLKRIGLPVSRSTLCSLFHQASFALKPIYERMLDLMPSYSLVLADETPIPVQAAKKTHKGYIWSFINDDFILYRYSDTRGGITPKEVLKESQGVLMADGYSGYNQACLDDTRKRAGCWAHARRKFFEAQDSAQVSKHALDKIKDLYQVEYDAANAGVDESGHLKLRQDRSRAILNELHVWLIEQQTIHPPKSLMGKAIGYTLNQWDELNHFVNDPKIPLDNNASERALRIIALGRKNYLFAGNKNAAENLAGLYSLMASCELHGINPEKYLRDVLIRVHTHSQTKLDELLPHRWMHQFD